MNGPYAPPRELDRLRSRAWLAAAVGITACAAGFFLEGDEEEARKAEILADSIDRGLWRGARDLAGTIYFGDRLIEAVEAAHKPFKRDRLGEAPITESISAMGEAFTDLVELIEDWNEGEADIFSMRMLGILADFAEGASPLVGNPFLMPYYRVRAVRGERPDENEDLQPTRR